MGFIEGYHKGCLSEGVLGSITTIETRNVRYLSAIEGFLASGICEKDRTECVRHLQQALLHYDGNLSVAIELAQIH